MRLIVSRGSPQAIWGFPKIRGTILGVPIMRARVFEGLHKGPQILGSYRILRRMALYKMKLLNLPPGPRRDIFLARKHNISFVRTFIEGLIWGPVKFKALKRSFTNSQARILQRISLGSFMMQCHAFSCCAQPCAK